jgi:hypothetical protein
MAFGAALFEPLYATPYPDHLALKTFWFQSFLCLSCLLLGAFLLGVMTRPSWCQIVMSDDGILNRPGISGDPFV